MESQPLPTSRFPISHTPRELKLNCFAADKRPVQMFCEGKEDTGCRHFIILTFDQMNADSCQALHWTAKSSGLDLGIKWKCCLPAASRGCGAAVGIHQHDSNNKPQLPDAGAFSLSALFSVGQCNDPGPGACPPTLPRGIACWTLPSRLSISNLTKHFDYTWKGFLTTHQHQNIGSWPVRTVD